jgi:hypothetical protein
MTMKTTVEEIKDMDPARNDEAFRRMLNEACFSIYTCDPPDLNALVHCIRADKHRLRI